MTDDPTALLVALDREAANVEIIVLDDGTNDPELARRVTNTVLAMTTAARFICLAHNEGRARGRNRLARSGRSDYLLFLDSDMLPDHPDFLGRWIELIETQQPDVAFGGFTLDQTPLKPEFALHRAMALKTDCQGVEVRQVQPEKHVFTSNLLVKTSLFQQVQFDEGFSGWGWEDVEWGMRVSNLASILHVDNTATHLGLDCAETLTRKYQQSAANFGIIAERHPGLVSNYPSFKVARVLRVLPYRTVLREMCRKIALNEIIPVPMRDFAMRLYRSGLYAEVI